MTDDAEAIGAAIDPRDDPDHPDHDVVCGWCGEKHNEQEQELIALKRILYLAQCYLQMFDVVGEADKQTCVDRERLREAVKAHLERQS